MTITLDARRMGREQVHSYLKEMLSLPDYYGCNLDALYDSLTELPETHLVLTHWYEADEGFSDVYRVLLAAQRSNPSLRIELEEF